METFQDYFSNLTDFVFKKDIIEQINNKYNVLLTDKEYLKIIKHHLENNIIAKSSNAPGKCGYISQSFLDKNSLDAISYYKSKKIDAANIVAFKKQIISNDLFDFTNCIGQLNLKEIFNEL